jgi:hypothetical protein
MPTAAPARIAPMLRPTRLSRREIQIVLARIQLQEERVRNATRQLQDARDRLTDTQTKKTELADRTRQLEMPISGELQSR